MKQNLKQMLLLSSLAIALPTHAATTKLVAPTGLKATSMAKSVQLKWTKVKDAAYYKIYRAESKTGNKTYFGTVSATNFTDPSAIPKKEFSYSVQACKSENECSSFSTVAGKALVGTMTTPKNLKAMGNVGAIDLGWNLVINATQYQIFKNGVLYQTVSDATQFSDTDVGENVSYKYSVAACDVYKVCSKKSKEVTASAMAEIVTTPTEPTPETPSDDDDILDLMMPILAATNLAKAQPPSAIEFVPAPIAEKCAISWDDSHQPTGTIHWKGIVPHPEWKKLSHCVKVITIGPADVKTLDDAKQIIANNIKTKMNSCVNEVLNRNKTTNLFKLVSAIAADLLGAGGIATTGVVLDYVAYVSDGTLECVKQLPDFGEASAQEFVKSFSVDVKSDSNWVYWDM